jgi:hypothetical protein
MLFPQNSARRGEHVEHFLQNSVEREKFFLYVKQVFHNLIRRSEHIKHVSQNSVARGRTRFVW